MYCKEDLFRWVNKFDNWTVKRSQCGFKYKAFLKQQAWSVRQTPFETGGYAFYHNGFWYPYEGVSLRKAQRLFAADLREWRRTEEEMLNHRRTAKEAANVL